MVKLTIDNKLVEVNENTTILDAAKSAKIHIPSLCYFKDLNEIGACRICVVEVEGVDRLVTACNNVVKEGMVVYTNSAKVRETRKINVELILSQHNCRCAVCIRSGNCSLQTIANNLGILQNHFEENIPVHKSSEDFPLIRDYQKCIKCMRCIQVCDKIQSLNIWDISNTGSRTTVDVSQNKKIEESDCSLCGQCITHCPVGALHERDDVQKVFDILSDPDKITVVQIAPAVRAAWGESLGITKEFATVKRLVAAIRSMGFDYIFDTDFSADLTIMEEASEFLERFEENSKKGLPMFTSCCPGWVRFLKTQYPELVGQLSSAKSPQQMFGAVAKSYYAEILNTDPSKIYCISIMPCTAKKYECDEKAVNDTEAEKDVDIVLTTREIDRMIKAENIIVNELEEEEFDKPLGISSGAGVIFGASGGVMEAALRTAYNFVTKENAEPNDFKEVRGINGWKEAVFNINDISLKVAVVNGLGNARKLIEEIKKGKVKYDFVEVMACPGGCSGGGGQPIKDGFELAESRSVTLYELDENSEIRFSHENPAIIQCYKDYFDKPLSEKSHKLLHTNHQDWNIYNYK